MVGVEYIIISDSHQANDTLIFSGYIVQGSLV